MIVIQKIKFHSDYLLNCKNDLKKTWKTINDILSRGEGRKSIKSIIFDNSTYTDTYEIASIFNDYFCSIGDQFELNIRNIETYITTQGNTKDNMLQ